MNFKFNKLKAAKNLNLKKDCKISIQTHQVKNKRDTLIMQIFILKYLTHSFRF